MTRCTCCREPMDGQALTGDVCSVCRRIWGILDWIRRLADAAERVDPEPTIVF